MAKSKQKTYFSVKIFVQFKKKLYICNVIRKKLPFAAELTCIVGEDMGMEIQP